MSMSEVSRSEVNGREIKVLGKDILTTTNRIFRKTEMTNKHGLPKYFYQETII